MLLYTLLAVLAAVLILSLRALSRTRHKLVEACAERARLELTLRRFSSKVNAAHDAPVRWFKRKDSDKLAVFAVHYDTERDCDVYTTIKVYYFSNAEEESYADLLADELLDKLNEDI